METELTNSYKQIKELTEHDSLTGLYNRLYFEEALRNSIQNSYRYESKLALLMIDLDKFKFVNDSHGHEVGDLLLKKVVRRIVSCLRGNECISRLGGDEFAIILGTIEDELEATMVARRILRVLQKEFEIGELRIRCSASVGIAVFPNNAKNAEMLIQNADIAMYRAKRNGRSQLCFLKGRCRKVLHVDIK